jgi:hypothetical protein
VIGTRRRHRICILVENVWRDGSECPGFTTGECTTPTGGVSLAVRPSAISLAWGAAGLVACALVGWWNGADPISLVVLLGAWLVFMLTLMKR